MKAYPMALRMRVVKYVKRGHTPEAAGERYEVGRATAYRWVRMEEGGKLEPQKSWGSWKKIDPAKLLEHVKTHYDETLEETAAVFGVSYVAVFKALRRLNVTRKKNSRRITSQTPRNA